MEDTLMDYIRFSVDGQRLDYDRKYYSSTDTIDTLYCNFKFETDDLGHVLGGWDLPYLWAQFHDENGNVYIKAVEDNVCSVPFDCLNQHKFKMTLFATDTQDYMSCTKRYTTNEIAFKFKGIANINYDGGVSPDEPMPANWQLLLDRVDECESSVDELSHSVSTIGNKVDTLSQDVSTTQSTVDGLSISLASEATARASADIRLEGLINDESTSRENADANLQLLINDRYTKTETDTLLDAESTARTNADENLQSLINAEATARASADSELSQNVSTLETTVSALDVRITSNTNAIADVETAVDGLSTNLANESTARANADTRLEGLINDEATARANADAELQTAIETDLSNYYTKGEIIKLLSNINHWKWTELVSIVQSGKADEYFNYGDQIVEDWIDIDNNNRAYQNPWDVAKFDDSMEAEDDSTFKGMYLKMHYAMLKGVQFSHQRAFYASADGLAAGTYNITFGANWGNAQNGKTYQFTLSQPVETGGRLSGFYGMPDTQPANWKVYSYGADGKTLKETVNVIEGSEGTSLGTLQLNTRVGNLNSMQETAYGCNDWEISAMRQYLNSRAGKGSWWQPQDTWDIAPDQLNATSGFLSGVSDDFYNAMKTVKVTTFRNNPTYSGAISVTHDKVFLPSLEEMYINPQRAGEGTYYPLMKAMCGLEAPMSQYGTYPKIITYALENHSSAQHVRLRSACVGFAYNTWLVGSSGYVNSGGASGAFRACPVCVIG